jgi:hypothetical protein
VGHDAPLRALLPLGHAGGLLSNVLMLVTGLATSVIFDKVIPHQAFVTLWAVALAGGWRWCSTCWRASCAPT